MSQITYSIKNKGYSFLTVLGFPIITSRKHKYVVMKLLIRMLFLCAKYDNMKKSTRNSNHP